MGFHPVENALIIIVCLHSVLATSLCGQPLVPTALAGMTNNVTIKSSGLNRNFLISLPSAYNANTPVPLIFSFHGRGKDARYQQKLSQFSNASYNPNAIAVYPNGFMNDKGTRQWQGDPDAPSYVNDIQFTLDIINYASSRYCLDSKRIFATGKSNGGGFVNLLACDSKTSSIIAAFGPVSGAFYLQPNGQLPSCTPSRSPVPIMDFHGWKDKTIPYEGGNNTRGNAMTSPIPQWLFDRATRDGCSPSNNSTSTLCSKKKSVIRYSWNCRGIQNALVHYNISNFGHYWPSIDGNEDTSETTCFDATSLLMEYFNAHPLP